MNPSRAQTTPLRPVLSVGRYSLFGELATGGMATVHYGRMHSVGGFNKTVAIKRMRRDVGMDQEFVAMFLDEARLTSRIEHPNVVATIDVVAEGGEVFLVLEYVRGESLERLRKAARARKEHIPVPIAVSIVCGVLAGLHAAHEAVGEDGRPLGIVHRDVSPQNILVGEDGVARISDFGIAKAESRLQVTQDGQMKGKLPYMAPEQLAGSLQLDRRADIFSATTVLWELLAGRSLFRADHPGETIAKVLSAPIPSLRPLRPDVPAALDQAIRRGLARSPDQRPSTAAEHAELLEAALGQGLASPRAVGAWVSSLAAEVLRSRADYVKQMESISKLDATSSHAGNASMDSVAQPVASDTERPMSAPSNAVAPPPKGDESSMPLGSVGSLGTSVTAAALQRSRTTRLAWIVASFAFVTTCAVIFLVVALLGARNPTASQPQQAASSPGGFVVEPVPAAGSEAERSSAAAVSSPAPPDGPEGPADAVPASSRTAAPPAATRPTPPRPAPTRPYLPDMP